MSCNKCVLKLKRGDVMILTYKECIEKYGNDYLLKKELESENLYLKEKGIYSSEKTCSELEVITTKYARTIFTGESAFYYHSLTDVIPDYYHLASNRTDTRIKDERVQQSFVRADLFDIGITQMQRNNITIAIYDQERMLLELMRFRNNLSFDYYKEIILSYRKKVEYMDIARLEEYASRFKQGDRLMHMIEMEVL